MRKFRVSILLIAVVCVTTPSVQAELYKCQSQGGKIEYSDKPCPSALRRDGEQWVSVEAERKKKIEEERLQKEAEIRQEKERIERQAITFISPANDFFGQPSNLCSALVRDGLSTEGWKPSKAIPGEWLCMTTLIPFGSPGSNGMENNIAYYVNGTSSNQANDIRIKININNPSERTQAFSRLDSVTKSLFKAISQPVPPELSRAISQQKPASVSTSYGKAELILEPGRIDGFKVVLTDARFLAAKEQTRNSSAGDFGSCKIAVGKAVGYSDSLLSGDGDPVQESGYKSFILEGQGKDLFFCEVYPGGRYKIKAARGGNFPFKYVSEGSF